VLGCAPSVERVSASPALLRSGLVIETSVRVDTRGEGVVRPRGRCGQGEPDRGADVGRGEPGRGADGSGTVSPSSTWKLLFLVKPEPSISTSVPPYRRKQTNKHTHTANQASERANDPKASGPSANTEPPKREPSCLLLSRFARRHLQRPFRRRDGADDAEVRLQRAHLAALREPTRAPSHVL
jgi:hypothetical protein